MIVEKNILSPAVAGMITRHPSPYRAYFLLFSAQENSKRRR
jgi:hypothetical protein